jgi:hypothetical protein
MKELLMKGLRAFSLLAIFLAYFFWAPCLRSQAEQTDIETLKKSAPKVYIDCGSCDIDYIRTEITFVNYVRDRKEAQVDVLITTQRTASGGMEYTLAFIGQLEFQGIDDTQKYFSNKTDSDDEIRKGLVKTLKLGLMGYVAKTPISSKISISYAEEAKPKSVIDKWKNWVFSLSGSGYFNGEKSYSYESLSGSFSASRVTPELKISMSLSGYYYRNRYSYEDISAESTSESYDFSNLLVKSLDDHWSVGGFLEAYSSTYENIKFALSPAPAIEYNLFPYSQSTRRQLRFLYKVGYNSVRYREETIYFKTYENLWNESLSVTLLSKEKWGSITTTLQGSHYFHDFKKNRLSLYTTLSLQLYKGLNFFIFGGGSRIHDQLYLAKTEASLEEVLLRRRALATSYSYYFAFGLSYTFGSIFTNVVNPRFGSTSSGGVSISIY